MNFTKIKFIPSRDRVVSSMYWFELWQPFNVLERIITEYQYHTHTCEPTVENSATVWGPYVAKNIQQVEMIQRRAARWVLRGYDR